MLATADALGLPSDAPPVPGSFHVHGAPRGVALGDRTTAPGCGLGMGWAAPVLDAPAGFTLAAVLSRSVPVRFAAALPPAAAAGVVRTVIGDELAVAPVRDRTAVERLLMGMEAAIERDESE